MPDIYLPGIELDSDIIINDYIEENKNEFLNEKPPIEDTIKEEESIQEEAPKVSVNIKEPIIPDSEVGRVAGVYDKVKYFTGNNNYNRQNYNYSVDYRNFNLYCKSYKYNYSILVNESGACTNIKCYMSVDILNFISWSEAFYMTVNNQYPLIKYLQNYFDTNTNRVIGSTKVLIIYILLTIIAEPLFLTCGAEAKRYKSRKFEQYSILYRLLFGIFYGLFFNDSFLILLKMLYFTPVVLESCRKAYKELVNSNLVALKTRKEKTKLFLPLCLVLANYIWFFISNWPYSYRQDYNRFLLWHSKSLIISIEIILGMMYIIFATFINKPIKCYSTTARSKLNNRSYLLLYLDSFGFLIITLLTYFL